ncbi:MAG: FAD-dependent oxidoreductase [Bacteroides sp.]|jgi:hypothetical protein|nr:FAD-dependent oxidoreductase [Bacteroides sp.]
MRSNFDHIIWGANAKGIALASKLIQQGQTVLLLNKFGFPGGKVTESLSCLFTKDERLNDDLDLGLLDSIRSQRFGVLFENEQELLLHPEAFKRALWEEIDRINIDFLFHVIPIGFERRNFNQIQLFGRQGHFFVTGKEIHDLSDEQQLKILFSAKDFQADVLVHCFITDKIPEDMPSFKIYRKVETPIGLFCSFHLEKIPLSKTDMSFNLELDRFAQFIWKNYGARLLMIPVQPEIIPLDEE